MKKNPKNILQYFWNFVKNSQKGSFNFYE